MTNEEMALINEITNYFHGVDETFKTDIIYCGDYWINVYCKSYDSVIFLNQAMKYDIVIKTKHCSVPYTCVVEIKADDYIDIGKNLRIISDNISDEDRANTIALNIYDYIENVDSDTFTSEDGVKCHSLQFKNVDIEQMGIIFQTLSNHVADFKTVDIDSTKTDIIIVFKKNNEFIEFCMDYFKGFKFRGYGF
jgi:hypothetical protein